MLGRKKSRCNKRKKESSPVYLCRLPREGVGWELKDGKEWTGLLEVGDGVRKKFSYEEELYKGLKHLGLRWESAGNPKGISWGPWLSGHRAKAVTGPRGGKELQEPSESGGCGTGLDHRSHGPSAGSSATITSRKKPGYQYPNFSPLII